MKLNPDRFYLRGTSRLGLFNTLIGCLFNRVLSKEIDRNTGKVVRWKIRVATDFPPYRGDK